MGHGYLAIATKGEYPHKIRVRAEGFSAEAGLLVELTGTSQLEAGTSKDLLSLDARQGNASNIANDCADGDVRADIHVTFLRAVAARLKFSHLFALYYFSDCNHSDLFRDFICYLYEAGNPINLLPVGNPPSFKYVAACCRRENFGGFRFDTP